MYVGKSLRVVVVPEEVETYEYLWDPMEQMTKV